jgi:hypothetical protein
MPTAISSGSSSSAALAAAVVGSHLTGLPCRQDRPVSGREIPDELIAELKSVHKQNYSCYGVKIRRGADPAA